MRSTKSRFALAAVLAALSAPALAADAPAFSVRDDPTWPALENPAPALALKAQGGESETLAADPTWPKIAEAAPALALAAQPDDGGPEAEPATPSAPKVDYAVVLGAPARRVAAK